MQRRCSGGAAAVQRRCRGGAEARLTASPSTSTSISPERFVRLWSTTGSAVPQLKSKGTARYAYVAMHYAMHDAMHMQCTM